VRLLAAVLAGTALAGCRAPCPVEPGPADVWTPPAPWADAPPEKPSGAVRFLVGGDSRPAFPGVEHGPDDPAAMVSAALAAAKPAGASAFLYLGDMERSPSDDGSFPVLLDRALDRTIPFCPVFGNHEALVAGALPGLHPEVARAEFVERFLLHRAPGCPAPAGAFGGALAAGRVFYAADLPGGVHFVALDNVSEGGFGDAQIRWLRSDLASARRRGMTLLVGMHKALAQNPVTHHSMAEDGAPGSRAWKESAEALAIFEEQGVALVLASHEHGYWEIRQRGEGGAIRSFITGGLGAPLKSCAGPRHAFYHYLVVDVAGGRADVTVVRLPG
jgi:hypothetical protein